MGHLDQTLASRPPVYTLALTGSAVKLLECHQPSFKTEKKILFIVLYLETGAVHLLAATPAVRVVVQHDGVALLLHPAPLLQHGVQHLHTDTRVTRHSTTTTGHLGKG